MNNDALDAMERVLSRANSADDPHGDVARALAGAKARELAAVRDQTRIVMEARFLGVPWSVIGRALGISKQAAQQRFTACP